MTKTFTFYWLDGKREVFQGNDPADALNKVGYGGGAVRALDFYTTVVGIAENGDNNLYTWNEKTRRWVSRYER